MRVRHFSVLVFSAFALVASAGVTLARTNFDGLWSVLVITEQGTCDRGYRYALRVVNGVVRFEGEAAVNVNGQVSGNGAVNVRVSAGSQGANGWGRLGRDFGNGSWRGVGSSGSCSGTWTAEKR